MTPDEFNKLAASKGFVPTADGSLTHRSRVRNGTEGNPSNPRPTAELERHSGDGTLGQRQIQNLPAGRVHIRLTSFRTKLLDEDNLCEKFIVDCCRYAGLIRQDSPGAAKIEVRQEKVGHGDAEFVRIEIFHEKGAILT